MRQPPNSDFSRSLPPLHGGLLWLYRLCWCGLAVGALFFAMAEHGAQATTHAFGIAKTILLIALATLLLFRRPRDPVAALLSLAMLLWTISSSFQLSTTDQLPQIIDRFRFLLFALTLLLFPDGRWQPTWTAKVAAASAAIALLGILETLGFVPTTLFLPLAILCIIAAIFALVSRFRSATDYALRQQLKWVALGLVTGVGLILCARLGAALSAQAERSSTMDVAWDALFQTGIVIIALGFLASLLRYRLFDAETAISRSAAYAALTVSLVATFGGTEALIENLGQTFLGSGIGSISGAMAAAVAAVLLNPFHARVSAWAEHRFQPDLTRLKRELPEALATLGTNASTQTVARAVLPRINAAIHATRSALLIDGSIVGAEGIRLAEARSSVEGAMPAWDGNEGNEPFPVRLTIGRIVGDRRAMLLLGPRPDASLFAKEDLSAVRSVLPAIQRALSAAVLQEALNEAIEKRELSLRNEVRDLNSRLQAVEGKMATLGGNLPLV
nr:hypothetical protein [Sphingomonas sp.]